MKKLAYIMLFCLFSWQLTAKEIIERMDSTAVLAVPQSVTDSLLDTSLVTPSLRCWTSGDILGTISVSGLDTSLNNFYVNNPALRKTVSLQYLGNLQTPAQSAIFADRIDKTQYLFFQPYQIYYRSLDEIQFYNTKIPFTYINYYSGGTSNRDNRRVNGAFTVNVNPKVNVGMYGDWTKAYGAYTSLSTQSYNAGFFGSYLGDHNNIMAAVSFNGYENYENGGFIEDDYITDPNNTGDVEPINIPVYFSSNAWNKVRNWNAYFNYKYNFGFEKEIPVTADSSTYKFIPVTSLIYTFSSESDWKRFYEKAMTSNGIPVDSFYHSYHLSDALNYDSISSIDSTRFWQMKHTIGITLNEEYNTLLKFGLAAYVTADIKKYTYLDKEMSLASGEVTGKNDSLGYLMNPVYNSVFRNKVGVGAKLSKHMGEVLTYDFWGEYFFLDEKEKAGTFNFGGNLQSKANWGKQPVGLGARVKYEHKCPDFYEEYYFSNHIEWNRDFDYKKTFSVSGFLSLPRFAFYDGLGVTVSADLKNLQNYIYWDEKALPEQYGENIQVLNLSVKENARLWLLHWDNEFVFQQCSNDEILPLPQLNLYSSFYFQYDNLFKVLSFQIGMDLRWNSAYYAPCYMPATGQFYLQNPENGNYKKYGNYPYMNAFINFHLKRARFYVEFNHINKNWFNDYNYLILPGYALDPSYLKFGISVTLAN